jgi:acetoin utilization protein AcuB
MRASEIMTHDPMTAETTASIADALNILRTLEVRHLPITDEAGSLVGMISDRDVRGIGALFEARPVVELMAADVVTIDPETEVSEIIDLLLDLKVGALPVVDDETRELMGIVSYIDVLRALRKDA